jgi:DNA-binding winged helix-turn-helix (wHTH) protein/TolB-like protein
MEPGRYRFGLFEFNVATKELRREGVLLRLQAQPAQVLACLIEQAGQVLSRDELRKAVWGDATFVDFESGLNFCISQLRSALRDDSAQPMYVRTVPKGGYQFIAPVERLSPERSGAAQIALREKLVVGDSAHPHRAIGSVHETEVLKFRRYIGRDTTWWIVAGLVLVFAVIGAAVLLVVLYVTPSEVRHAADSRGPILAVARFDNETADPAVHRFADGLADNVVEQLMVKSGGSYRVIGNAQILRVPREQRDLRAIGASLHADYVVLGQVQGNGEQLRILAHLIRLPDQTHIWVARLDRPRGDELQVEADAAEKIASEFAARMAQQPEKAPSFAAGSH